MANLKFKVGGVWNPIVTIKGDKGDAGDALPIGGTVGQLLIKQSSVDNDATWQNNPTHDDRYYTETEVNTFLSGKSNTGHTHTIANVTGLQTALDGKVDDSQVLTNVPAGAVFTDTVYTHPTTDGSLHVPATSTTNSGRVLTAGATAGSLSWVTPTVPTLASLGVTATSAELNHTTGVTSAIQTQLNARAPIASPTFTGTVGGITATMVGLGNVTNENKATMFTSPNFTGVVTASQIQFPATQVPSSNPNTLDDYEEGAFTPNILGETTAGTATYTNRQGRYIKIGGVVHFQIYLNWSSLTGTGAMVITGLPFANGSVLGAVTVAYPNLIALPASGVMTAHINASLIYLTSYPSGGGAISFIQCDAGGELMLSGTYMV